MRAIILIVVLSCLVPACTDHSEDCVIERRYWSFPQFEGYDCIDSVQLCGSSTMLISHNRYALVVYPIDSMLNLLTINEEGDTVRKGQRIFWYAVLAEQAVLYRGKRIEVYRLVVAESVPPDNGLQHLLVYARPYGVISFTPYEGESRDLQKIERIRNGVVVTSTDLSPLLDSLYNYPEFWLRMP